MKIKYPFLVKNTHIIVLTINYKNIDDQTFQECFFRTEYFSSPLFGLNKMIILQTCNRIEVYGVTNKLRNTISQMKKFFCRIAQLDDISLNLCFKLDREAVSRLFRVAASLESMVVGENKILSQIKSCYHKAHKMMTTSTILNKLFQAALETGKRVWTQAPTCY